MVGGDGASWWLCAAAVLSASATSSVASSPSWSGAARSAAAAPYPPAINPIGGNADIVDYRGRTQMFVNVVRQAQPFMQLANHSAPAAVDERGWPVEAYAVDLQVMGADMVGEYAIQCAGEGSFKSLLDGAITKHKYDQLTGYTQATLSITDPAASGIALSFDGAAGCRNLTVMLPGFTAADEDTFNPLYIKQLQRFSTVRFIGMSDRNTRVRH